MTDSRDAVIDRILSGAPGPTDDASHDPDPPAWWDEERDIGLGPAHDWASHGSDAFGLMAIVAEEAMRGGGGLHKGSPLRRRGSAMAR